jgi:hypothetical protein
MCDYSVSARRSRKAAVGDKVIVSAALGSNVLVDQNDQSCAICLTEGDGVLFDKPIKHVTAQSDYRVARYTVLRSCSYRDGLQLPDGAKFPVAYLYPGQTGTVDYVPPKIETISEQGLPAEKVLA